MLRSCLSSSTTCSNEYRKIHSLRGVGPLFAIFSKEWNFFQVRTQGVTGDLITSQALYTDLKKFSQISSPKMPHSRQHAENRAQICHLCTLHIANFILLVWSQRSSHARHRPDSQSGPVYGLRNIFKHTLLWMSVLHRANFILLVWSLVVFMHSNTSLWNIYPQLCSCSAFLDQTYPCGNFSETRVSSHLCRENCTSVL